MTEVGINTHLYYVYGGRATVYPLRQQLVYSDVFKLFYDLRKNNGRPKDEKLKPFWSELQKYLDEVAVVDDRRETPYMFMPLAMSLTNLISIIKARLPGESPCPSVSWLRLNFWPCNAYTRAAMCYTGVFKVKYAVQQRLLRQKHQDSAYAFQLFAMFKEMAVKYGEVSEFISLDDKSIVPIGEPNKPVSTGVRPHNRALVPEGVKLYALDHDFHIHGAVPSVLFRIDIPSNSRDSFYNGNVHVLIKDKVFNPSSALRHATETVKILRSEGSADGVNLSNPLLFVYTDGGPDHRTNFISVQLSYLVIFFALDLDMLIAARTAPSQSYANPAERCMSLLNMALQHVSLQRREMDANSEVRVKSLSSLKKLRSAADKQPALREKLMESLEPVLAQLKQRFSQLKLHDDPVLVHDAASDEEMKNMSDILDILKEVDGGNNAFSQLKTKSDVVKFDKLKDFVERHWRSRPYSFQIKKCKIDCWYCTLNPPRLPDEVFAALDWLPDPTLNADKSGFLPFSDVYGKETTAEDCPSVRNSLSSEEDKKNKPLLVAAKVRAFIICCECGKRRVVYCSQKLSHQMCNCLDRVQEELFYSCGSPLLPDGHQFNGKLLVREGVDCSSPIETTYYAGAVTKFADICFFCGDTDIVPDTNETIKALKQQYSIVRPICPTCNSSGKLPAVRNAMKARLLESLLVRLFRLRLNFWPCNAYTRAAMCYTGVFKVKYAVQQRLLRQKHQDSAYAFQLFAMFKEMAVKYGEVSEFISLDDKSIVPIGEPNKPVSTGVRPHNRALVPEGVKLYALDHDFHIHGAVPSVLFRIDIPSNSRDSFYNGNVHVTVKDKVFNPSSALRHATETVKILRSEGSADGVNLSNPCYLSYRWRARSSN
ncbi:unnamed protein product [Mytilus edulis]|uniref:Uncharacterized protein n=1 Tax=Mytilus edulis TaxID=6550 RepID=A0A8S3RHG5_MYTED|nr:unnamed protein product [Mytilus edulis]